MNFLELYSAVLLAELSYFLLIKLYASYTIYKTKKTITNLEKFLNEYQAKDYAIDSSNDIEESKRSRRH